MPQYISHSCNLNCDKFTYKQIILTPQDTINKLKLNNKQLKYNKQQRDSLSYHKIYKCKNNININSNKNKKNKSNEQYKLHKKLKTDNNSNNTNIDSNSNSSITNNNIESNNSNFVEHKIAEPSDSSYNNHSNSLSVSSSTDSNINNNTIRNNNNNHHSTINIIQHNYSSSIPITTSTTNSTTTTTTTLPTTTPIINNNNITTNNPIPFVDHPFNNNFPLTPTQTYEQYGYTVSRKVLSQNLFNILQALSNTAINNYNNTNSTNLEKLSSGSTQVNLELEPLYIKNKEILFNELLQIAVTHNAITHNTNNNIYKLYQTQAIITEPDTPAQAVHFESHRHKHFINFIIPINNNTTSTLVSSIPSNLLPIPKTQTINKKHINNNTPWYISNFYNSTKLQTRDVMMFNHGTPHKGPGKSKSTTTKRIVFCSVIGPDGERDPSDNSIFGFDWCRQVYGCSSIQFKMALYESLTLGQFPLSNVTIDVDNSEYIDGYQEVLDEFKQFALEDFGTKS